MEDFFEYIVSMRDTDATGFVFHPKYLEIFTVAREAFAKKYKFDFKSTIERLGIFLVVYNLKIKYLGSAEIGQILYIKSRIIKISNLKITLLQEIYSDSILSKKITEQEVSLVFLNKISKLPVQIPREIVALSNSA